MNLLSVSPDWRTPASISSFRKVLLELLIGKEAGERLSWYKCLLRKPDYLEFEPQDPHKDGRRERTTQNCPLASHMS